MGIDMSSAFDTISRQNVLNLSTVALFGVQQRLKTSKLLSLSKEHLHLK